MSLWFELCPTDFPKLQFLPILTWSLLPHQYQCPGWQEKSRFYSHLYFQLCRKQNQNNAVLIIMVKVKKAQTISLLLSLKPKKELCFLLLLQKGPLLSLGYSSSRCIKWWNMATCWKRSGRSLNSCWSSWGFWQQKKRCPVIASKLYLLSARANSDPLGCLRFC